MLPLLALLTLLLGCPECVIIIQLLRNLLPFHEFMWRGIRKHHKKNQEFEKVPAIFVFKKEFLKSTNIEYDEFDYSNGDDDYAYEEGMDQAIG